VTALDKWSLIPRGLGWKSASSSNLGTLEDPANGKWERLTGTLQTLSGTLSWP
jgi:hypothetical protein